MLRLGISKTIKTLPKNYKKMHCPRKNYRTLITILSS